MLEISVELPQGVYATFLPNAAWLCFNPGSSDQPGVKPRIRSKQLIVTELFSESFVEKF
jgi:hypothetical protein